MVAADATTTKPGPSLLVALVVVGLGVLVAVTSGVIVGVRAFRVLNARATAIPGVTQRQLGAGTWIVYQNTGQTAGGAGFTFGNNGAPDLQPNQVTVTGPDGNQLVVQFASENDTITKNSKIYTSAVEFTVATSGRYTLTFDTTEPGAVLVTRSLGDTVGSLAGVLVAFGAGAVLVVTGLALLFVGIFRRQRAARPAFAAGGGWSPAGWSPGPAAPGWSVPPPRQQPAPGWYPDPQVPGGHRWWDGTRWTEHHS